jgi:steroid delta-isomerase
MNLDELVRAHVHRFNAGVASGDFGSMLHGFAGDADLVFEGVPLGPYAGRAAIAEAYRTRPPDDTIELLGIEVTGPESVVAAYAWSRDEGRRSGEMRFSFAGDGRIDRLVVAFGQAS